MSFVAKKNVNNILKWLKDSENVALHGINSSYIVSKDMKIIIALLWCIILHFHVRGEDLLEKKKDDPSKENKKKKPPYNECVFWVNELLKDTGGVQINQLSDWSSGKVLLKIIETLYDMYGNKDHEFFFKNRYAVVENKELLRRCIDFAEKEMKIPSILTHDEFLDPEKLSIITYMAYFRRFEKQKLKDKEIWLNRFQEKFHDID